MPSAIARPTADKVIPGQSPVQHTARVLDLAVPQQMDDRPGAGIAGHWIAGVLHGFIVPVTGVCSAHGVALTLPRRSPGRR